MTSGYRSNDTYPSDDMPVTRTRPKERRLDEQGLKEMRAKSVPRDGERAPGFDRTAPDGRSFVQVTAKPNAPPSSKSSGYQSSHQSSSQFSPQSSPQSSQNPSPQSSFQASQKSDYQSPVTSPQCSYQSAKSSHQSSPQSSPQSSFQASQQSDYQSPVTSPQCSYQSAKSTHHSSPQTSHKFDFESDPLQDRSPTMQEPSLVKLASSVDRDNSFYWTAKSHLDLDLPPENELQTKRDGAKNSDIESYELSGSYAISTQKDTAPPLQPQTEVPSFQHLLRKKRPVVAHSDCTAPSLESGGVTAPSLASGGVTAPSLASGDVTAPSLASGDVTSPSLASGGVTAPSLASGDVTSPSLASGGVTAPSLASSGVTAPFLASVESASSSARESGLNMRWSYFNMSFHEKEEEVSACASPHNPTASPSKASGIEHFPRFTAEICHPKKRGNVGFAVLNLDNARCVQCERGRLKRVQGLSVFYCSECDMLTGEDDTMYPPFALGLKQGLGAGRVVLASLSCCGNSDPNEYIMFNDATNAMWMRCRRCGKNNPVPVDEMEEGEEFEIVEDEVPEMCESMQCQCGLVGSMERQPDDPGTVACRLCHTSQELFSESPKRRGFRDLFRRRSPDKERKCSVRERDIRPGDHLCWDRPYLISHHAIVTGTPSGGMCDVVHYSGPANSTEGDGTAAGSKAAGSKLAGKAFVQEERVPLHQSGSILFRMEYNHCHPPEEVVRRARSRVGHGDYNLLFNNCESFVRWCKKGEEVSQQTRSLVGRWRAFTEAVCGKLKMGQATPVSQGLSSQAMAGDVAISLALVAGEKVMRAATRGAALKGQRDTGELSKSAFLKVVVREVAQGVGGAAGAVLGAILGTLYIPVVGTVLGATLGTIIGDALGGLLGQGVARAIGAGEDSEDSA